MTPYFPLRFWNSYKKLFQGKSHISLLWKTYSDCKAPRLWGWMNDAIINDNEWWDMTYGYGNNIHDKNDDE